MLTCKKCIRELDESNFYKSRNTKSGYRGECKACTKVINDRYNATHREKRLHYSRNAEKRGGEARRKRQRHNMLKRLYNISLDDWNKLLDSQGGKCAICSTANPGEQNWRTDHDHKTGKVRGILCNACNSATGLFRDNPTVLNHAARYVTLEGIPTREEYGIEGRVSIRQDSDHSYKDAPQAARRMYLYGISQDDWEMLFKERGKKCAICQSDDPAGDKGWHTDHSHETGNVRGILCGICNLALGQINHDPVLLRRAATYICSGNVQVA